MRVLAVMWVIFASVSGSGRAEDTAAPDTMPCAATTLPDTVALEAFGALTAAFRGRLPGPSGAAALERTVGRVVGAYLDFERFARRVLGAVADGLDADERVIWTARLASVIERRYLSRMGSPLGAHLAIRAVSFACPEATLSLAVTHRDSRKNKDFLVVVRWSEGAWRAVDAIVDEVSLVALYRGRFARAFRDGGVAGARTYLDALYARYGTDGPRRQDEPNDL